jgi:very-short-patch-repair endonuclease
MRHLLWPIIGLAAIAALALVAKAVARSRGKGAEFPYQKDPLLFTPAERAFLDVLEQALGGEFRIMGKVRLADILKVRPAITGGERLSAFNSIQSKHLDFVACDPDDFSIQFAVELDDRSHNQRNRQDRDAFLDKAMEAAGLPIIRFPAKATYSVQEVSDTIAARLTPPTSAVTPPAQSATPAVPVTASPPDAKRCPACGGDMVLRKASKGQNAGNEFWGCSNYPKCRKILPV